MSKDEKELTIAEFAKRYEISELQAAKILRDQRSGKLDEFLKSLMRPVKE
jgi:hypothetical protein